MRRLLLIAAALLLVVLGGTGWVVFQYYRVGNTQGAVHGSSNDWPAFWQGTELVLAGSPEPSLLLVHKDGTVGDAGLARTPRLLQAATSPDGGTLVVIRQDSDQSIVWRYREGQRPAPIAAVRGEVTTTHFSPSGRDVVILVHRGNAGAASLLRVGVERGLVTQVANDTAYAEWAQNPEAVVSVDRRGQMWYHGFQLSGQVDPPLFLGNSLGNAVPIPGESSLAFSGRDESGNATVSQFAIVPKEQRLISPLNISSEGGVLVEPSPNGTSIAVVLPAEPGQENGTLSVVSRATGAMQLLPAIGRRVRWRDETTLLFERLSGNAVHVWLYPLHGEPVRLLDTEDSRFAS